MVLAEQLRKFVAALPPAGSLAIFARAGDHVVLLQDFTSDHALLSTAIAKAIPHLQQPGSWASSDLDTLQQMLTFLRPYPGRKNLIWFSGGSNLALLADANQLSAYVDMRPMYDALEASRIAVFPIDARGLTTQSSTAMIDQQMMMGETAEATGGQAFYNNNGLSQIASRIVQNGDDFYTLTYYPHEPKFDNKWHRVKVVLAADNQSYQLSYRRGYFNDASNTPAAASGPRSTLRVDGASPRQPPDVLKAPILFSAGVQPAALPTPGTAASPASPSLPPKKNQTAYTIHYTLPADAFTQQMKDGKPHVTMGTGVLAVNRLGTNVARQIDTVTIGIDPDSFRAHPNGTIGFEEGINLPKGDQFLYIMVWDKASGRFGIIQAPVTVPKQKD